MDLVCLVACGFNNCSIFISQWIYHKFSFNIIQIIQMFSELSLGWTSAGHICFLFFFSKYTYLYFESEGRWLSFVTNYCVIIFHFIPRCNERICQWSTMFFYCVCLWLIYIVNFRTILFTGEHLSLLTRNYNLWI